MKPLLTGILMLLGAGAVVGFAVCAIELLGRWLNRGRAKASTATAQDAEPADPFLSYDDVIPHPPIRHVHVYRGGGWHGPKRTDADFDRFLADCLGEHKQTGDER